MTRKRHDFYNRDAGRSYQKHSSIRSALRSRTDAKHDHDFQGGQASAYGRTPPLTGTQGHAALGIHVGIRKCLSFEKPARSRQKAIGKHD